MFFGGECGCPTIFFTPVSQSLVLLREGSRLQSVLYKTMLEYSSEVLHHTLVFPLSKMAFLGVLLVAVFAFRTASTTTTLEMEKTKMPCEADNGYEEETSESRKY